MSLIWLEVRMNKTDFLDRKIYYCKACKKSFSIRESNITSVWYGAREILHIRVWCPKNHRMKMIGLSKRKDKKAMEEYLESEEYLSKKGGRK